MSETTEELKCRLCKRCGQVYGPYDDHRTSRKADPGWEPTDGRCYGCSLDFLYELYGPMMEPCFTVGNTAYHTEGSFSLELDEDQDLNHPHEGYVF